MKGFPRERAPAVGQRTDGALEDDPHWLEIADAAWLAAARMAEPRGPAGPSPSPSVPLPPTDQAPGAASPPPERGAPDVPEPTGPSEPMRPPAETGTDDAPGPPGLTPSPAVGEAPDPDATAWASLAAPAAGDAGPAFAVRVARPLRLLRRRVPSRRRVVLDEEATARHGLADRLWLPQLRPAEEQALDLMILADAAPTMPIWASRIDRLGAEAARSGAFRDVRTAGVELPERGGPVLRWPGGRAGTPEELLDGRGSRVHLLVTDGLSHGWSGPAADELLLRLAAAGPTAVVHLLPAFLWHRSSLHPYRTRLDAGGFAVPNRRVGHAPPDGAGELARVYPENAEGCVPVPVLSLKEASFDVWARLVAGAEGTARTLSAVPAGALAGGRPAPGLRAPRPEEAGGAGTAVRRFTSLATPPARRLATQLAAAPFDFAVIEELRERLSPTAGPAHVAEILMGGLIDWESDGPGRPDFAQGVREELLATGTRTGLAQVVGVLAEVPSGSPNGGRLRAALSDPEGAGLPATTEAGRSWARAELAVLRALAGPYALRAARVADHLTGGTLSDGGTSLGSYGSAGDDRTGAAADAPTDPEQQLPASSPTTTDHASRKAEPTMLNAPAARPRRAGQPKVMGNVPPKNPNFTGRESLLMAVEEQLRSDETAAVLPHALHGMGGVGKSQIAIEYVYRHSHEYNVIWWIPAEQDSMVLGALAELARNLGLEVGPQANTAVPAVREALRSGKPYDNWLLVFDNAEDIDAVRSYFPTGGPGKIIVTSRNRDWERVATPLTVNVFERAESVALLQRRSQSLSAADADRLAEALGDLPLAIEQAGAWHATTGMPVETYLELLEQRRPGVLELDPSPDYPVSVAAAWDISLERLADGNPAARQLLEICACMAPEPIPHGLLRSTRNVEITPELDPVLRDPVLLARATRDLSKLSLIKLDHKNNTLQMHRLMQAVLIGSLSPEVIAQRRHAAHILLATEKPGAPQAADQWAAYQALMPHIVASGAVRSPDRWVRELIHDAVMYLYYWGAHEAAMALAREAWTAWQAQSGEEDLQALRMAKVLAFLLQLEGQLEEGRALNEAALEVSRRASVPDEELIDSMSQMASALRYDGDFFGARGLDTEALSLARDLFGPEDPATLLAAHSLGVSLRLCGEFFAARELDEETAQQWELLYGPANSLTLNTMNGLAIDLRETGDFQESRALQEEIYTTFCNVFGEDNAGTVRAARNLAVCRRRDGALTEAWQLTEDVLGRFERRYGPGSTDTLAAAANATVDRRLRGDLEGAREAGERVVSGYLANLGPNHPHTLVAKVNLAAALRAMGDPDAAEALDTEALTRFSAVLGNRHVSTLTASLGRASDHYARLEFAAAREYDETALEGLVEVCGADHPLALACRANLALDLRGLGEIATADELNGRAVAGFSGRLASDHPWLTAARLHQRIECDLVPMPM